MKRALCLSLMLLLVPDLAAAQMNFEGLDLGGKKKKKKDDKKDDKKKEDEKKKDEGSSGSSSEVKMPEGGLDLTKPVESGKKDDKKGTAPTMSFEGVDVSGNAADRQKLDAAVKEFKNENYELAAMQSYDLMNDPKMASLA